MIARSAAPHVWITGLRVEDGLPGLVESVCEQARLPTRGGRHMERGFALGHAPGPSEPERRTWAGVADMLAGQVDAGRPTPVGHGPVAGISAAAETTLRIRNLDLATAVVAGVTTNGAPDDGTARTGRWVIMVLDADKAAIPRGLLPLARVTGVAAGHDLLLSHRGGDPTFDPIDSARVLRQALGDARRKAAELDLVLTSAIGLPRGTANQVVGRALGHLHDAIRVEHLDDPDDAAGLGLVATALERLRVAGARLVAVLALGADGTCVALVLERSRAVPGTGG